MPSVVAIRACRAERRDVGYNDVLPQLRQGAVRQADAGHSSGAQILYYGVGVPDQLLNSFTPGPTSRFRVTLFLFVLR